ncbi:MAG: YgaP family membrane protein [Pseudobdellovibrionaceae bacterium]
MKCNVALWDRILRFIFGVGLTTYAIAGGPFWAYIGIYGLITAAWGLCPLYAFFRIKTLRYRHRLAPDEE